MFEDTLFNYMLLYVILEIYEVQWQKANTIIGMLARMYEHYRKSAFIFLLMHPTLYFAIMFMLLSNFNEYAVLLFLVKGVDVVTKMVLLKKVFIEQELSKEMSLALLSPLSKWMPYIGLLLYPPLLYMAFTPNF